MTATDDDDVEGDEILALNGTAAGDLPGGRFGDADDDDRGGLGREQRQQLFFRRR